MLKYKCNYCGIEDEFDLPHEAELFGWGEYESEVTCMDCLTLLRDEPPEMDHHAYREMVEWFGE